MYSFWIPQIWRNARRGSSQAVERGFVVGTTVGRLALPLCEWFVASCWVDGAEWRPSGGTREREREREGEKAVAQRRRNSVLDYAVPAYAVLESSASTLPTAHCSGTRMDTNGLTPTRRLCLPRKRLLRQAHQLDLGARRVAVGAGHGALCAGAVRAGVLVRVLRSLFQEFPLTMGVACRSG
jgi:hypothetical protein